MPIAPEVQVGVEQALRVLLTAGLIALTGFGIYAVYVLVGTLRSVGMLADGVAERLPALIEDTDVAVQAVSLELMRLDDILMNVQQVSDTVEETTNAAREAVHVPLVKVAEYAERARRFIAAMRER
ncbi:MAG TPA: hypothetical protein VGK50_02375 [Coriobacteriia bacterium]|jgi:hypothetical protein